MGVEDGEGAYRRWRDGFGEYEMEIMAWICTLQCCFVGLVVGLVCRVGQHLPVPVGSLCCCSSLAIRDLHWMLLCAIKGLIFNK